MSNHSVLSKAQSSTGRRSKWTELTLGERNYREGSTLAFLYAKTGWIVDAIRIADPLENLDAFSSLNKLELYLTCKTLESIDGVLGLKSLKTLQIRYANMIEDLQPFAELVNSASQIGKLIKPDLAEGGG